MFRVYLSICGFLEKVKGIRSTSANQLCTDFVNPDKKRNRTASQLAVKRVWTDYLYVSINFVVSQKSQTQISICDS